jgi:hypothetical protein
VSLSFKNILMVGLLMTFLLVTTSAFAQGQHHEMRYSHHQSHAVSPFDGDKANTSLHCLLKSQTHHGFCPHSEFGPKNAHSFIIATDCGGKTSGTIPNLTSFHGDFAEINYFSYNYFLLGNKLASSGVSPFHRFIDSLDPPPRVL